MPTIYTKYDTQVKAHKTLTLSLWCVIFIRKVIESWNKGGPRAGKSAECHRLNFDWRMHLMRSFASLGLFHINFKSFIRNNWSGKFSDRQQNQADELYMNKLTDNMLLHNLPTVYLLELAGAIVIPGKIEKNLISNWTRHSSHEHVVITDQRIATRLSICRAQDLDL